MRLLKAILISVLIITVFSLAAQERILQKPYSQVILTGRGFVVPSARVILLNTNPTDGEYMVSIFDPETNKTIFSKRTGKPINEEILLSHSGPYYVLVDSELPVVCALKGMTSYPSKEILNIEYSMGGVSAFLLAFLMFQEGRK
ncbi:hypothetical protein OCC_09029 [Thermococcus litoralis DSM 5473]|uniref:Uncharacterized protein n=1 Tax=Thermococcus litoralis (strain ATCC 51850 / DSM 5473 / JCM 8560 / NS-C) TaxID=523849 RepID=H3ZKC6_THELN|nr:hypothetical protein [Thermococcus litoralis]EHR79528.1 hypothetical protein OCC_09029 [Thermococcus litoralis DSM 5473]